MIMCLRPLMFKYTNTKPRGIAGSNWLLYLPGPGRSVMHASCWFSTVHALGRALFILRVLKIQMLPGTVGGASSRRMVLMARTLRDLLPSCSS